MGKYEDFVDNVESMEKMWHKVDDQGMNKAHQECFLDCLQQQ